jgi:hypothetical protein
MLARLSGVYQIIADRHNNVFQLPNKHNFTWKCVVAMPIYIFAQVSTKCMKLILEGYIACTLVESILNDS